MSVNPDKTMARAAGRDRSPPGFILWDVRFVLVLACVLLAWPARAGAAPGDDARPTIWARAADPQGVHGREVAEILALARQLYTNASRPMGSAADEAVRKRLLDDARGMLGYATRLMPDHMEVVALLAQVEEASGRETQALALYQKVMDSKDPIPGDVCVRHGLLLVRVNQLEQGVQALRACVDLPVQLSLHSANSARTVALVHLANLYADQGRITAATSLLGHYTSAASPDLLAMFALAVVYDKDEQISRAWATLDTLKSQQQRILTMTLVRSLEPLAFVPAADRHYYLALLYEAGDYLAEARQEWHNYLRNRDQSRYARRARQHIEAIDARLARTRRSGP